ATVDPRKDRPVFARLSQPRWAAHATTAGAVNDRKPATTPIRNASNSTADEVMKNRDLEIADYFRQEPGAALGFVDPVLDQARRRNILMLVTDVMCRTQEFSELEVIAAKLSQHIYRSDKFCIV